MAFCLSTLVGKGQVLENYVSEWETQEELFLWNKKQQSNLQIPVESYPEAFFKFQIPANRTVFIEGKLWKATRIDTAFAIPVKSLKKEFGRDSLSISIIGTNPIPRDFPIRISKEAKFDNQITEPAKELSSDFQTRIPIHSVKDFYYLSSLVLLFFLAVYRMVYPYLLGVLLNPSSIVNAEDFSESGTMQKFISVDILFFLFLVGLLLGQSFVTGALIFREDLVTRWIGWNFTSITITWIILAFLVFALMMIKFGLIRIFGFMFDLGKSDLAHFIYLLRLTVFGASLINLICLYYIGNDFLSLQPVFKTMVNGFFWFYLSSIGVLFLIMMTKLSFKKYHLFTYLCVVEIVPFFILCKWIMVLGQ